MNALVTQLLKFRNRQRGVTLLELVLGIAITGIVMTLMVSALFQASANTQYQRGGLGSLDEIRRVLYAVTQDFMTATSTNLVDGAAGVATVTITTTDPSSGATHTTAYARSGNTLNRTYDGAAGVVGRYVTGITFSRAGSVVSVTATSTASGAASAATSTWTVYLRPA
ncbi:MAG: type II secretion system protein [Chloroflexi bacterium]|nr:type II secretion system protein [Chloroflexota bacterium]